MAGPTLTKKWVEGTTFRNQYYVRLVGPFASPHAAERLFENVSGMIG